MTLQYRDGETPPIAAGAVQTPPAAFEPVWDTMQYDDQGVLLDQAPYPAVYE